MTDKNDPLSTFSAEALFADKDSNNDSTATASSAGSRARSEAFTAISDQFARERDRRKEERFLFVAIITVLVDGFIFMNMAGWAGQVVIGIIQLFGLAVYARHCGIQEVDQLIDRFLSFSPLHNRRYRQRRGSSLKRNRNQTTGKK